SAQLVCTVHRHCYPAQCTTTACDDAVRGVRITPQRPINPQLRGQVMQVMNLHARWSAGSDLARSRSGTAGGSCEEVAAVGGTEERELRFATRATRQAWRGIHTRGS